ncbi:NitT/TauT family transport system substrate-binding protein [Rhizobiales bacterium GAS188]|nr:NitT/TauT family transport system substrate-binding protein [Rhizobiales bacterium GAS188]
MTDVARGLPIMGRRRLLQLTAAGVSMSAFGLGTRGAGAADRAIRWVSPRGTLEVVDDFAYWVAKKYGYFGDLATDIQAGPLDATATVKLVDQKQSDFGYPSPGIFSLGLNQGMDLVSVFHVMASDVFDFAFQKGKAPADLTGLKGKTILLGSAGWQAITDPMLAAAGVDIKSVKYIEAGNGWAQSLAQGQGDAALSWEGLRAQWRGQGLNFDYLLGKRASKFPANSYVARKSDLADPAKVALYGKYLRGWAMGMEFGLRNPRAATQITVEQFPGLVSQMNPSVATESLMQELQLMRGRWDERKAWGFHIMDSWQSYFDSIAAIGQVSKTFKASDVVTNQLIAPANAFDAAKVKADAEGFKLSGEYAAVDVAAIEAAL